MELVIQVQGKEMLISALELGVSAVAVRLSRDGDIQAVSTLKNWQAQARRRGLKFYLIWDWLVSESQLSGAAALLDAVAKINPDALEIRDLGLCRLARRNYPHLRLHAADHWGCCNSPGLKLAESLGFARVSVPGPISLKDIALMRRQTALPLEVSMPPFSPCYPSLCLMEEYRGVDVRDHPLFPSEINASTMISSLEALSGFCQLGVEAVHVRAELFSPESLPQAVRLFQSVIEAPTLERPQALAAARQVLQAFGDRFQISRPPLTKVPSPAPLPPPLRPAYSLPPAWLSGQGPVWLEGRTYDETAILSRQWRGPVLLTLTPENYAPFLKDHRRWNPRRLIWRLPPAIRESALSFYQKALETLWQGRYSRYVAGDWGGVALARAVGGEVWGDQALGVRNSLALEVARDCRVTRVCLPPGRKPEDWQELFQDAAGRFWGYLYHTPALAICSSHLGSPPGDDLRWEVENGLFLLCDKTPVNILNLAVWLKRQGVAPLVAALPRSSLPIGEVPLWLKSRPQVPPKGRRRPPGK